MLPVALELQISLVSIVCGNVFGFAWIPEFINDDWLFVVVCNMNVSRQGTSGRDEAVGCSVTIASSAFQTHYEQSFAVNSGSLGRLRN